MKSFRINDELAVSEEEIRRAFLRASVRKRTRSDVSRILNDLEHYIASTQEMLTSRNYKPRHHEPVVINEVGPHKQRTIIKPDYYPEQVTHHVVVQALMPAVMHGMDRFVLGSVPDRGAHDGKKYIEKWLRRDTKHTRVVGKLDVHHFFPSIDHRILRRYLHKKIRPGLIRDLCELIIDGIEEGLPLGFYTSQWFANFLLQPLDSYIRTLPGVYHFQRYMDDIVIFGSNKKEIHEAMRCIRIYLKKELNLEVKGNWQVFRFEYEVDELALTFRNLKTLYETNQELQIRHKLRHRHGKSAIILKDTTENRKIIAELYPDAELETFTATYGRPLDFMGFEFHRNRTILRKSIMIRATRKAKLIGNSCHVCHLTVAGMISYMGWIDHTNTYGMYLERVKPYVNVKKMKKIVSKHQRRLNHAADLQNCQRLSGDCA